MLRYGHSLAVVVRYLNAGRLPTLRGNRPACLGAINRTASPGVAGRLGPDRPALAGLTAISVSEPALDRNSLRCHEVWPTAAWPEGTLYPGARARRASLLAQRSSDYRITGGSKRFRGWMPVGGCMLLILWVKNIWRFCDSHSIGCASPPRSRPNQLIPSCLEMLYLATVPELPKMCGPGMLSGPALEVGDIKEFHGS
jgi:hypothetical protein